MASQQSSADRYKAALEKARAEQAQSNVETPTTVENKLTNSQHSEISYSQTKVLPASAPHLERGRIVASSLDNRETDIFRLLRTQILHRMRERDGRTLAVCSARDGAGKTFVAINLALTLARDVNHTVMLVDLDLRRPRMHQYFDLQEGKGLIDVLSGEASLDVCLVNPGIDRLVLLPNYRAVRNSSELLLSPQMANLASELRARYEERIIIYDLPPVLQVDDFMAFINNLDSCLFVVEDGVTTSDEIDEAINVIGDENLIGTVLNKVRNAPSKKYGYY